MNILMTLSQLELTGAEVYATTIGNELAKRGHHLTYASDTLSKEIDGQFLPTQFNRRSLHRRIWQVLKLICIIKLKNIQLVHAHSRAAGWVSAIACKVTKTPMITTVHGRQPVHSSRRIFHAFGYLAVAVAEDIKDQIVWDLGIPPSKIQVLRNAIDTNKFKQSQPSSPALRPIISLIGRLTGPKGELCYRLVDKVLGDLSEANRIELRIITSSEIPLHFKKYKRFIEHPNPSQDIADKIKESHLIVGAGRVAVEGLLVGRPVFAIGEAKSIGLITVENFDQALRSNFGDIGPKELDIDFSVVKQELEQLLEVLTAKPSASNSKDSSATENLRLKAAREFNLTGIVDQLEDIYQSALVDTLKREMPILMYHRVIANESEKGIHGTWVTERQFERHIKLIKKLGYETLTFHDFAQKGFIHRFEPGKKYLMITADDGYRDNLTRMLPILEKYNTRAVVFVVSNETYNRWDTDHPVNPDVRADLLSPTEIRALESSGRIEIGGHTLSHARLDELESSEQREEIKGNKQHLEDILGHPIISFAYPYGNVDDSAKSEVKAAGYRFAVATDSGPRALHKDPFQIRRIAVFPRTGTFGLWRKIRGNYVWRR